MSSAFHISVNAAAIAAVGIYSHCHNTSCVALYTSCSFIAIGLVSVAVHRATLADRKRNRRIYTRWK